MIHKNRGFTLIEMLIVIVILGIIFAIGVTLFDYAFKIGFLVKDQSEARTQAQYALERMSDEVRNARSATNADLGTQASRLVFTTNEGEDLTFRIVGTDLRRNNETLATGITNLSLTYLSATNTTTSDSTEVRCIVIDVTFVKNDSSVSATTTVCPRNYNIS